MTHCLHAATAFNPDDVRPVEWGIAAEEVPLP